MVYNKKMWRWRWRKMKNKISRKCLSVELLFGEEELVVDDLSD
jgi:hypothetical protein